MSFFGTDVRDRATSTRSVYRNDAVDGSARNTFRAAFDKELRGGEAQALRRRQVRHRRLVRRQA